VRGMFYGIGYVSGGVWSTAGTSAVRGVGSVAVGVLRAVWHEGLPTERASLAILLRAQWGRSAGLFMDDGVPLCRPWYVEWDMWLFGCA
jgi:hypothetical protein